MAFRKRSAARAYCRVSECFCGRMRTTEHAPRGPFYPRASPRLADIVEGGAGVLQSAVACPASSKSVIMTSLKNTQCHRNRFEQQCLGFCVAVD